MRYLRGADKFMISKFKKVFGSFFGRPKRRTPIVGIKSTFDVLSQDPAWAAGSGGFAFKGKDNGDEAMKASIWVYACARVIATTLASIPLKAYQYGEEVASDHPLAKLLREPIPGFTQSLWLYLMSLYITTGGEAYLEKIRASILGASAIDGQGLIKELWCFPGSYFEPNAAETARKQVPASYSPQYGDETEVATADIIHIRRPRPSNINAGFGPVEGAESEISTDSQASAWQQSALKNRGVPDGIFKYTGELGLDGDQEVEIDAQLDARWTGLKNSHRPFVLGQDMDWIDLSKSMVELELIPGRNFTKEAICSAMGVPDVIFSASQATYANLSAAMLLMMTFTIMPQSRMIADSLTLSLAPEYGEGYTIEPAPGVSMAMLPMVRDQWSIAKDAMQTGAPMAAIFESVGLKVEEYPGIEQGWVASGLMPSDTFSGTAGPSLSGQGDTDG